jgi:L-alanine-DL-glutamate epimerase-like enolase superfamily enzyme
MKDLRIVELEFIPVSIAYTHREVSSQVRRDGVTDIVVKATTADGLVGWGESCSGADVTSVEAALHAMCPFVVDRSPWESEAIRAELWLRGLWQFRKPTAAFAYAGIDMALWDICGKATGQPLCNLLGGRVRSQVEYFYYLARGDAAELQAQCAAGVESGYTVFYLKVGIDIEAELEMVRTVREAIGPSRKLRLDANAAWSVNEALRNLTRLDEYTIDFIEQPVAQDPAACMQEVRARSNVAVAANEGMWTVEDAYRNITSRVADVFCFSSYWVGSLLLFQRLAHAAHFEGLQVCKHTHGELGLAAAASQHLCLTLPNLIDGNQQTAQMMEDDILTERLPIADGPAWGTPDAPGLGVDVDPDKLERYHEQYREHGQLLPYDPSLIGSEM